MWDFLLIYKGEIVNNNQLKLWTVSTLIFPCCVPHMLCSGGVAVEHFVSFFVQSFSQMFNSTRQAHFKSGDNDVQQAVESQALLVL